MSIWAPMSEHFIDICKKKEIIMVGISTVDNPYNPLTQFDDWYRFDMDKGYSTCCLLARMTHTADLLDDDANEA